MNSRTGSITRGAGVDVVDQQRMLELAGLALAVLIPILGLPMGIHLVRRARDSGRDVYLAKLGLHISIFLISLYLVIAVIGLFLSVVLPSISA